MVVAKKASRVLVGLARCGVVLSLVALTGCGSVGDAVNPVNWYRGVRDWVSGAPDRPGPEEQAKDARDFPKVGNDKRPEAAAGKERAEIAKGLAADRANAQYTQETLRREGNPTRPLSAEAAVAKPMAPLPEDAPPPPPKPSPVPAPQSRVSPPPAAQQTAAVPPPPAAQQTTSAAVPPPPRVSSAPAAPATVEEIYRRRLAEFDSPMAATPVSAVLPTRMPVRAVAAAGDSVMLTPPVDQHKDRGGRFKSLESFDPSRSAASFEVGEVVFGEGTAAMSSADTAPLREIAGLAREKHGALRLIGHSSSLRLDVDPAANREANRQLALRRADVVGLELVRLGVPAGRIYAGAAPDAGLVLAGGSPTASETTEIYIDY